MSKSLSTSLIVRGILAFGVGIIAVAWPQVTVFALVILFATLAFIAAGQEATWAFSSTTARPVIRHLLLGLIDAAAGVVALLWPAPTALVLVLIVASWAVVTGLFEFFAGSAAASSPEAGPNSSSAGWCPSRSASCCSPARTWAQSPSRCSSACST
jgi:uncharacterized membrane protein HdeD (DUF308 family)